MRNRTGIAEFSRPAVVTQLIQGRAIEPCSAVPIVGVFFDEDVPAGSNLFSELHDLALDSVFFFLQVGTYSCI